jgi:hypothetical protein
MLADTTVTSRDVTTLLTVLVISRRHIFSRILK